MMIQATSGDGEQGALQGGKQELSWQLLFSSFFATLFSCRALFALLFFPILELLYSTTLSLLLSSITLERRNTTKRNHFQTQRKDIYSKRAQRGCLSAQDRKV